MHGLSFTWITALVIIAVGYASATRRPNEALPTNYDRKVTPGESTGEPTAVKVSVYLISFQVQEQAKTASCQIYFRQSWMDMRLQSNQSGDESYRLRDADCDEVWLPDTFIATQVAPSTVDHRLLTASPSGAIRYTQRMYVTVPLVYQESTGTNALIFRFESFGYRTDKIIITSMQGNDITFNGEAVFSRRIYEASVTDCTEAYTTGNWSCLSLVINVARYKSVPLTKQLHVFGSLTFLVVALSWTAFWLIPSSTGATVSRVLIGLGTSILSFVIIIIRVVYTEQFGTSNSCDILIGGCVLVVTAAFVESVIVIVLTSGESTETKVHNKVETGCTYCHWSDKQRRIDLIAKVVHPIVVGVFVIVFIVVAHS